MKHTLIAAALLLAFTLPAAAQDSEEVQRFMKGLILTEQKKNTEAIAIFIKLTEDFPELPEPYNNLAVIYGQLGQYEKARAALEMAIRTHPSYATAHENLGDVYARLASQAYDKALQLDTTNTGAQVKLAVVRDLIGGGKGAQKPGVVTAASAATAKPAPAPAPVAAPTKPAVPSPAPTQLAQAPAAKPAATPPPAPAAAATSSPAPKPAPVVTPSPAPAPAAAPAGDAAKDVLAAVSGWASAWSNKDMKRYLDAYSADFKVPGGVARKAWEEDRRARIEGKAKIQVTVQSPQVTVAGDTATVNFRQVYDSDKLDVASRKTLVMVRKDGRWLIREERSGR
jgi:ketosteroid isomerase-like protein